jgi:hypothetical protein
MPLRSASLDEVTIDDEAAFVAVALYPRLRDVLRAGGHRFLIPTAGSPASWDRALFLNLTFWNGADAAEVLSDDRVAADVVAHAAWHRVVSDRLPGSAGRRPSADGMLFGEAIASAFDLYLVGRLLTEAPGCDFIDSQVPIMGEAAQEAGLSEADFAALLTAVCGDPEQAFEDLRRLLLAAATALLRCGGAIEAQGVLEALGGHRFASLLHHYQLSNWILYARAYGEFGAEVDPAVTGADLVLRAAPSALGWLAEHWVGGESRG